MTLIHFRKLIFLSTLVLFLSHIDINAKYTLTKYDVKVVDGIITQCYYDGFDKEIVIPKYINGQLIKGIANAESHDLGVFYSKGIRSVIFSESIEEIGDYAFYNNFISEISFNNNRELKRIGSHSFDSNLISSLDLRNCTSLIQIDNYAFSYNELQEFILPINQFYPSTYWIAKNQKKHLGGETVSAASNGYTLFVPEPYILDDDDVEMECGVIINCTLDSDIKNIIIPEVLHGQSVIGIGKGHRYNKVSFANRSLTAVSLPSTIEFIDNYAFYGNHIGELDLSLCSSLKRIGSYSFSLNRINLIEFNGCNQLESIEEAAFASNSLGNFDLSPCTSLLFLSGNAFDFCYMGCGLPSNLNYPELKWTDNSGYTYEVGSKINKQYTYFIPVPYTLSDEDVVVEDGVIVNTSYEIKHKNLIIPEVLDGQTVRGIKNSSFNTQIYSISLPPSLKFIDSRAFFNKQICKIDFGACTLLESIGSSAFNKCNLKELDLSSCSNLKEIGENSFSYNHLETIKLEGCRSLVKIGSRAFYATSISNFTLPDVSGLFSENWEDDDNNIYKGGAVVTDKMSYYYNSTSYI
ncbi:MAG: leucine-rich repeat domain-containing protein, partial [Bacteroidales bacterium]|nr:leucine-rich repeat domain-containing protein [Bacteroidales bacterium]